MNEREWFSIEALYEWTKENPRSQLAKLIKMKLDRLAELQMAVSQGREPMTIPMQVSGEWVTSVFRSFWEKHDGISILDLAATCLPTATCLQILNLSTGRARIIGVSPDCFYEDIPLDKQKPIVTERTVRTEVSAVYVDSDGTSQKP